MIDLQQKGAILMGKMLVISFKDNKDEKVFHEVVNLLEQYEFQPTKEIKYQPVLTFDDFDTILYLTFTAMLWLSFVAV